MKTAIIIVALLCCATLSAQTITVQNGAHQYAETWAAPAATNGVDYTSEGVVVQVSGITPDVKPLGSTAPYCTCTAVINPGGIDGLTVTRQQISASEVHFIVGGIPNDVPGNYNVLVYVEIVRYYPSAPTIGVSQGLGVTLQMQLTGAQPGSGSDGDGDSGGSDDANCSTSAHRDEWLVAMLAALAVLLLARSKRYRKE